MRHTIVSEDSIAIGLLCTPLGLNRSNDAKPLSSTEYGAIASAIARSELSSPGGLFGQSDEALSSLLQISPDHARRLVRLLQRGVAFAVELERLHGLGIWFMTRADDDYPRQLRRRLGYKAPATFFGLGKRDLLRSDSVAVVGSRDVSPDVSDKARRLGNLIASAEISVVSGGSRGVDSLAMAGAMDSGGTALGVMSEGLERALYDRDTRQRVLEGQLTLISPYIPRARFSAGNAMARNKVIYCLSRLAIVASSAKGRGGTWSGAVEALRAGWVPVYVRSTTDDPGSAALIEHGANLLPVDPCVDGVGFVDWLRESSSGHDSLAMLPAHDLFDDVWDRIAVLLAEYRTSTQVALSLRLEPVQAASWLNRAVQLGWVTRKGSPPAYRLVTSRDGVEQIAMPLA